MLLRSHFYVMNSVDDFRQVRVYKTFDVMILYAK